MIVYLICNFNGLVGEKFVLLIYFEVIILFYEFGYGLYYMLIWVEEDVVFGIVGVVWDVVELFS